MPKPQPSPKLVAIEKLHPAPRNPRVITEHRLETLKKSMTDDPAFMWCRPVLAQKKSMDVYAGNMRLRAAIALGWKEIPCIITDIPEKLMRERQIRDNSEFGDWQGDELAQLLDEMKDMGTDLELLGLEDGYLKDLLEPDEIVEDEVPEPPKKPKTKLGDLYLLGEHRLLCGDACKKEDVERLMGGKKADCVFVDPPYGVSLGKKNRFLNSFQPSERNLKDIQDDDKTPKELYAILLPAFKNIREVCSDSCAVYVCSPLSGDFGLMMMMMMMNEASFEVRHQIVWKKNSPTFSMGRLDYDYQHEAIIYTWTKRHEFYGKGTYKTTVWDFDKPSKNKEHPSMKPVGLVANALQNSTKEGQLVIDTYGGSGTTLIAAEELKRKCYMMEIDPAYCDVIIARWEKLTGKKAERV